MADKLIARQKECAELDRCMGSDRSEFVIIYGRRRIGKTFLIDSYFNKKYDFTFVGGHRLTATVQLRNFDKALEKYSGKSQKPSTDWYDAFDRLEEYLDSLPIKRKKTIFIDEMPWIDTQRSQFVNALENFWNGWANRRNDIFFVASGSSTSWMVDNLIENQGGLHARITGSIYLRPFTLNETEQYLKSRHCNWDRYQILQTYMFFGGVPFYLSILDVKESLVQNVDRLCFAKNAILRREFDELYNALFPKAYIYISVAQLLSEHKDGLSRDEISEALQYSGAALTNVLNNMERCDFIARYPSYKCKQRASIYRLIDFYTLFYYKFIDQNFSRDERWWSHNFTSHSIQAWQGITFELLCMSHHEQIKAALGIAGMATNVSMWRSKGDKEHKTPGYQIDMIIERADRMIHLCEMKFSQGKFKLTDNYSDKLRDRMDLFREATKTTKALVNTFVTTYGVADGKYSSLVHGEVTMNDLFMPTPNI